MGMGKEALAGIELEFKGDREDLIPALQRIQEIHGYLPKETIKRPPDG